MTEYYKIVDFEKLTFADFFKRYFPEKCNEDSFNEDGSINSEFADEYDYFGLVCDMRNYTLQKRGFQKGSRSYVRENEKRIQTQLSEKGWDEFPFNFVMPFDEESHYVIIGNLKKKEMHSHIIIGNTILCPIE